MKTVTFNQWLIKVIGEEPQYFDNNYSGMAQDEIYEEYDYYLKHPEEYAEYFTKCSDCILR